MNSPIHLLVTFTTCYVCETTQQVNLQDQYDDYRELIFVFLSTAVQSLNSLNDQIAHFMVNKPSVFSHEDEDFLPSEKDTLAQSMALMRHLLMDAQVRNAQIYSCKHIAYNVFNIL